MLAPFRCQLRAQGTLVCAVGAKLQVQRSQRTLDPSLLLKGNWPSMYAGAIIVQQADGSIKKAPRLPLGETHGRDEAWLRDLLFSSPETVPVGDLDPSFGPLVPLCRELRTEAGPVDIACINGDGLLTLIECKLWRNPEARRKVVAQVLDYARAIVEWTYADLQRQVSIATGKVGNVPFELARAQNPDLEEHRFVDAASRAMRSGQFQLLVAGDGIREDVGALAELINRNAALAFSFSMFEVALYALDGALVIHPRVIAKTVNLERSLVLVRDGTQSLLRDADEAADSPNGREISVASLERARWWLPLESFQFDDPEQQSARFTWPNNLKAPLPIPGLWLSAYRTKSGQCGVFLGGRSDQLRETTQRLLKDNVLAELPTGTAEGRDGLELVVVRREAEFPTIVDEQRWLAETLNHFANVLRPRLKRLD